MAGFREFVTGEVLTAANVDDFLMKQSVQKYADAAARDAALGTAVAGGNALREGMVAYLDSTDELLKYDGNAWATIGAAGIGSNVVTAVSTNTFSTTSTTYQTVTGLTLDFTPTSAGSKVLVVVTANVTHQNSQAGRGGQMSVFADAVNLVVPSSPGDRTPAFARPTAPGQANEISTASFMILDSPNTTSPVTYDVRVRVGFDGTTFVNRSIGDDDSGLNSRAVSTITAIEVAA